jgi:hypothetical protein
MLINLPKGLFYIIKKEYLCDMFLQYIHIAPFGQLCRKSQQMLEASVCE